MPSDRRPLNIGIKEESHGTITPGVWIEREYGEKCLVHPPGWMWVLAFAIGGCEWAIKEADTEEFREIIRKWYEDQKEAEIQAAMDHHYREIERLKKELRS